MTVGIHICRSQDPSWQANVGYDPIAEPLFNDMKVGIYFLEYDNARSGGFEPLRSVPPGKVVVLGLVASKVAELEAADELKRRIEEASRYVRLEQLALSPQCGFSTSAVRARRRQRRDGARQARPHRRGRARGLGRLSVTTSRSCIVVS